MEKDLTRRGLAGKNRLSKRDFYDDLEERSFEDDLEERSFEDQLELEARSFGDWAELDSRSLDHPDEAKARPWIIAKDA